MAKRYQHVAALAQEISTGREERGLSYEKLGLLADVDVAQAFRICRGEFKTLNPGVLRICKALGIRPLADETLLRPAVGTATEARLSAEVLAAWDRTEEGAKLLVRVLRALHQPRSG